MCEIDMSLPAQQNEDTYIIILSNLLSRLCILVVGIPLITFSAYLCEYLAPYSHQECQQFDTLQMARGLSNGYYCPRVFLIAV